MADRLVIDASVAVKWFVDDESDIAAARSVLEAFLNQELELYAPQIFTYEVCCQLAKACARRVEQSRTMRLTPDIAATSARELFGLPLRIFPASEAECVRAIRMSAKYSKGFYDMTYLRLAEELQCDLCTADARMLKAFPKSYPVHRIVLLAKLADR